MLGLFRYILAIMVAYSHLWPEVLWWQGSYAVFCFYLISGYLMSLILNQVYVGSSNRFKYLANRALRIYPPYLVVMLLSVFFTSVFYDQVFSSVESNETASYVFAFQPDTWRQWLKNFSLVYPEGERLIVTQAWSLRIELIFYVAMIPLIGNVRIVAIWFVASVLYVAYLGYIDSTFFIRFSSVLGSSIAFSLGAMLYYMHKEYRLPAWHLPIALALYLVHWFYAAAIWGFSPVHPGFAFFMQKQSFGIYLNLFLGAYLLYSIISMPPIKGMFSRVGKGLGNIAYAIFLIHWLVVYVLIILGMSFEDKIYFVPVSFVVLNITAIIVYQFVEKPINHRFRDRIRPNTISNQKSVKH